MTNVPVEQLERLAEQGNEQARRALRTLGELRDEPRGTPRRRYLRRVLERQIAKIPALSPQKQ